MNKITALLCGLLLAVCSTAATAATGDYKIDKVTLSLLPTPQITFTGEQRTVPTKDSKWLEVEVQFQSNVDVTDEMTFKYYVLVGQTLLVGEVTHVNVQKGRELHSVMYVSPRTLTSLFPGKPITIGLIQNAAVQLLVKGVLQDELFAKSAQAGWYQSIQQTPGLLLNKNETPFAPLYWDRYEVIKPK
jgi:hypothetical protein